MSDIIEGNTIQQEEDDEFIGFDDDDETIQHDNVGEEETYEDCLKDKYKDINYSKADKINLIKKIEMYLYDPDFKKMVKEKIHLAPYIDLSSMKKKKDFNELDGPTLNWIYDELRDSNMNSMLTDVAFNGYLSINNIIESIAVSSGYVKELEGYSEKLDTPMNRTLVKQITIDNFNYFDGRFSPQYLLLFNTMTCMSGTYKYNKKKFKAMEAAKKTTQPEPTQPEKLDPVAERVKNVFGNNPLPGFS